MDIRIPGHRDESGFCEPGFCCKDGLHEESEASETTTQWSNYRGYGICSGPSGRPAIRRDAERGRLEAIDTVVSSWTANTPYCM